MNEDLPSSPLPPKTNEQEKLNSTLVDAVQEKEQQQLDASITGLGPLAGMGSDGGISKYRPVSIATGVAMVTVYGLYTAGVLKKDDIDCSNQFVPIVARDFTHTDLVHLAFNMISLFYVSKMEAQFGSIPFLALMGTIIIIATVGTIIVTKLLHVNCAIGFSGVLLGLMTFGLVTGAETNFWWPLIYLVASSVIPVPGQRISISGHAIGIATGLLLGLGYRYSGLNKKYPVEKVGKIR